MMTHCELSERLNSMHQPKYLLKFAAKIAGPILFALVCCSCGNDRQNKMAKASSPYLRQHADNPVDWYPWGDDALKKAKTENKPLLVSVGYAACHWCHVMEQETFTDTTVARIMNENFVCIKVDREERPDIDNIYSSACQLLTGSSGWPLHAFALPDGRAFFAGTYYSKQSWLSLLKQISQAYKTQHNKVVLQAQGMANGIAARELSLLTRDNTQPFSKDAYRQVFDSIRIMLDVNNGGTAGTPKFPAPYVTEFLLQNYFLTGNKKALEAATTTLTKMALGGIYDQVGGGFSRYAVDSQWHIPHFEKMLYDNAQLLSAYAHAYQVTKNPLYKTIMEETAACLERDFESPEGGYYSSLNADTKEGEGVFYSWTAEAFQKIATTGNKYMAAYYNITDNGNWQDNSNIPYASETPAGFAAKNNMNPENFQRQLTGFKQQLFNERSKRINPSVDKKIITAWNALTIKAWLDAYAALGNSLYLDKAIANAEFIEKNMINSHGKLWRSYMDGKGSITAFLEDYSYLCDAFIQLYQLTFDTHWLSLSRQLAQQSVKNFKAVTDSVLFVSTDGAGDFGIQSIPLADNAMPAANAVMARALYYLSVYYQNDDYLSASRVMLSRVTGLLNKKESLYYTSWVYLAGLFAYGTNEVVIIGPEAKSKNVELHKNYYPQAVFMGSTGDENLPLLEGKKSGNKTLIYVCTNKTCKRPLEEPSDAAKELITN
jgi:uncharacterized protein